MEYFKPYEGDKPYIFVSYAHADSPYVMEIVGRLHERGYRIWYDEGIEVGSEWPECIASHLSRAHLVMAFISNSYMRSDNCRREMHYALTKRIKTINIFLEDTVMTPGMEMQIGNIFALMKHSMSQELFYQKLYTAPLLNSEPFIDANTALAEVPAGSGSEKLPEPSRALKPKKEKSPRRAVKRWILLGMLLLIVAAGISLAVVGYFTGLTERVLIKRDLEGVELLPPETEAVFRDQGFEAAARNFTGIVEGELYVADLAGIRELYIIGGSIYFELPESLPDTEGIVNSLEDVAYFTGLDTLWLINQPLRSLATMPESNIEYLNISGCRVSSIQGIGRLIKLRELVTDGCPVTELGDINHCLSLRSVSLIGSSISDYSAMKPLTKLTSFAVSNCATDEMRTVLRISSLTHVALYDCDLRGKFFFAFDKERTVVSLTLVNCELNSTRNLHDFKGLTNLCIVSSGGDLDWSALASLPDLRDVTVDESCYEAISDALAGTDVKILMWED